MIVGGYIPSNVGVNNLQYVTIAQTGNTVDFGDLTRVSNGGGCVASRTRGVMCIGSSTASGMVNSIDFITL